MLELEIKAQESIRRLRKFASVMQPDERQLTNEQAAIALQSEVGKTFRAEGATEGRPRWEPLKAGGRWKGKGKNRSFSSIYQILQDTGHLRASFNPLFDENVAGVGAISGTEHADLAPIHQFGNQSRNLPARPMLPTEDAAIGIVTKVYGLAIERAAQP